MLDLGARAPDERALMYAFIDGLKERVSTAVLL